VRLEKLFEIEVEVEEPISDGTTPNGEVRVIPFAGGRFSGPGLQGRLLPGGSDWQTVRPDGVLEIRARYLLETDRGERIEVISEGIRHAAPGVLERIARGEPVAPGEYYFRTFVRLRTAAERLAPLNLRLAIAAGERTRDAVHLSVYAVP
jgi:Protein of unknown function (DUF3237)